MGYLQIQMILNDYNYLTGYEIGHEWQKKFRKLQLSERLNGKIPFVLGGSYSIENLYPINLISLLDFRAAPTVRIVVTPTQTT